MSNSTTPVNVEEYLGKDIKRYERIQISYLLGSRDAVPDWARNVTRGVATQENPRGDVVRIAEAYSHLTPQKGEESRKICNREMLYIDGFVRALLASGLVLRNFKIKTTDRSTFLEWVFGQSGTFVPHSQIEKNKDLILEKFEDLMCSIYCCDGWENPHFIDQVDLGLRSVTLNIKPVGAAPKPAPEAVVSAQDIEAELEPDLDLVEEDDEELEQFSVNFVRIKKRNERSEASLKKDKGKRRPQKKNNYFFNV